MRRAARVDGNHAMIRDGLREIIGRKNVYDSSGFGDGFPDLVCEYHGLKLLEIKMPSEPLTAKEKEFAKHFPVSIVNTLEEALKALGL